MGFIYTTRRSITGGGFADPRDFGNIAGWWRLDLGVTLSSGNVSALADQSSAGNDVSESTNQPLFVSSGQNSKPCARFTSGSSHVLWKAVNTFGTGAYTIAMVGSCANSASPKDMVTSASGAGGVALRKDGSNNRVILHQNVAGGTDAAMGIGVECFITSRTAAAAPSLWVNRASQALAGAPATMADPGAGTRLAFGAYWLGAAFGNFASMDLYECAMWTRQLSDRERQDLENYLMNRYAL